MSLKILFTTFLYFFSICSFSQTAGKTEYQKYEKQMFKILIALDYGSFGNCRPLLYSFRFTINKKRKAVEKIQILGTFVKDDSLSLIRKMKELIVDPKHFPGQSSRRGKKYHFVQPVFVIPRKEYCDNTGLEANVFLNYIKDILQLKPGYSSFSKTVFLKPLEIYYTTPVR